MTLTKGNEQRFAEHRAAWRVASAMALVSGAFSLVVCAVLIINYVQITRTTPLDDPALLSLREQLAAATDAEEEAALIEQIRALDLLTRKAFFTSQAQLRTGGELLLGGVIVFLAALRLAARWNPKPPSVRGSTERTTYWDVMAQSKELITGTAIILALVALTAAYFTRYEIPSVTVAAQGTAEEATVGSENLKPAQPAPPATTPNAPEPTAAQSAAPAEGQPPQAPTAAGAGAFPTWEQLQEQWPSFRGPGGIGVAHYTTAPTEWDVATGKNIRWKVEVPLPGRNSPVVWGDRVFLSGGTKETREVLCFSTDKGELLWRKPVPAFPGSSTEPPKVSEDTGYAASTMVAHGDRVCAIFPTGDCVCFDFAGNQLWGVNLGLPENHYGYSSSLIAYGGVLLVQYDDRANPRLIALDLATGKEAWAVKRRKISWASPACVSTPFGMQVILASEKDVDAYDPVTGTLLWTQACLDAEVAPSPAYSDGMVFVANEYAIATAIRLTDSGGKPQPSIAWQWEDSLPDVSSPLGTNDHFYIATSMGEIVCLNKETGEQVWLQEFDEGFYSSPILVGDRIYALDLQGVMRIFKTGAAFELVGAPALGEPALATPAYLDKRIYVRTEANLLCIENNG